MKRDMDLLREVVLKVEAEHEKPDQSILYQDFTSELLIDGYSASDVEYHLKQALQAELLEGKIGTGHYIVLGLTPRGHDFADAVRDPLIWRRTRDGAIAAGGLTLELVIDLAKGFLKRLIKEKTEIEL